MVQWIRLRLPLKPKLTINAFSLCKMKEKEAMVSQIKSNSNNTWLIDPMTGFWWPKEHLESKSPDQTGVTSLVLLSMKGTFLAATTTTTTASTATIGTSGWARMEVPLGPWATTPPRFILVRISVGLRL